MSANRNVRISAPETRGAEPPESVPSATTKRVYVASGLADGPPAFRGAGTGYPPAARSGAGPVGASSNWRLASVLRDRCQADLLVQRRDEAVASFVGVCVVGLEQAARIAQTMHA